MTCLQNEIVTIYRGEALDLELDIFTPEMRVQKLTAIDEITVSFLDEDGNVIAKNTSAGVTIVDPDAGQIKVELLIADTAILPVGEKQSFEAFVEFTDGKKRTVAFERVLTVKARIGA